MYKTDVKYVFAVSKVLYNTNTIDFNNLFSNFNKETKIQDKVVKLYNPCVKKVIEVIHIKDLKNEFNSYVEIKDLSEKEVFFTIKVNKTNGNIKTFDDFSKNIEESIETSLDFLKRLGVIETKEYNTYILQYKLVNVVGYYGKKADIEKIMKKFYEMYGIKYKLCLKKSLILYIYEESEDIIFSKKKEKNSIDSIKIFKDKFSLFINFDVCKKPLRISDKIINKVYEVIEKC